MVCATEHVLSFPFTKNLMDLENISLPDIGIELRVFQIEMQNINVVLKSTSECFHFPLHSCKSDL